MYDDMAYDEMAFSPTVASFLVGLYVQRFTNVCFTQHLV